MESFCAEAQKSGAPLGIGVPDSILLLTEAPATASRQVLS